ncbi:MAG: ferritin-like domain-containing protein [Chthoniobacterales bacterium]|nr:ferritin-like domain-containing protein [Chthoniobacterales bacterium]
MPELEAASPGVAARDALLPAVRRRSFLKFASATALAFTASGLLPRHSLAQATAAGVSLGSGDTAVLNYAFALEQLEAEFYTLVAKSFYRGINERERRILTDIRDHEIAHVDFYRAKLGRAAIPKLQFNFQTVNFADRLSVLTTARTFEDTGVSAYNGAGQLLRDPRNLAIAGKIVSVEGRHAAILHDLLEPRGQSFAGPGVIDSFGLDLADPPSAILAKVKPYIVTAIDPSGLPRS